MVTKDFITPIKNFISKDNKIFIETMLKMDAVKQMLFFLYFEARLIIIRKTDCYSNFFKSPDVIKYCDKEGIEVPSEEASKHRIPFIFTILQTMGVLIEVNRSEMALSKLLIYEDMFEDRDEGISFDEIVARLKSNSSCDDDLEDYLKSKFGSKFLYEVKKLKMEVI